MCLKSSPCTISRMDERCSGDSDQRHSVLASTSARNGALRLCRSFDRLYPGARDGGGLESVGVSAPRADSEGKSIGVGGPQAGAALEPTHNGERGQPVDPPAAGPMDAGGPAVSHEAPTTLTAPAHR